MSPGETAAKSPLDKPLHQLTEDDISQLTREDCRRYLKEKGTSLSPYLCACICRNEAAVVEQIAGDPAGVVIEVCKRMPTCPGRHLFEGGEQRCYFGLKTAGRGVVEFECKSRREYDMWTRGVARLLTIVAESRCNRRN
ncbi:hypothetical protein RJ640_029427 [Escallonia rubra]|uniref:Pleckstrin-like plant domain-containing protein n=1 Tax=Escallonia rubra TaxID=112253 RepID=A0AA88RSG2_9ASTE|nr:hypothetical protein RJ640_029427 [Escallonia rubra]